MTPYLEKIIAAAADGGLILTSNKRLSRHLQLMFDRQMIAEGKVAWETPAIFSFDGWWGRMLAELDLEWQQLDGFQQKRLWQQIIEEDSLNNDKALLHLSATAEKATQAAQLLSEYQVELEGDLLSLDQLAFKNWLQTYRQLAGEHGWQDRSLLIYQVLEAFATGRLKAPQQLILTGFDQQSPLLLKLCQQITAEGGQTRIVDPEPSADHRAYLYPANDSQHEIVQAACWTRALLQEGVESIGIVVMDLQARRSQIERIFRDQIDPQAVLQRDDEENLFSLSLGTPLIEQGPIHAALEILSVGFSLSLDLVSFLLRTPYLQASLSEADQRAIFDSRLRSFRQASFRLTRLVDLAKSANRIPAFVRCLEILGELAKDKKSRMPGEWAVLFDEVLTKIGWPGERSLASNEYQMVCAWRDKLLPGLASLDMVSQPLECLKALGLLRQLAADTDFQLEAPTGSVQVVGLLESAGLEFEHLWVMGMTEDALPAAARPNPFLPVSLQASCQMPHSSPERELDFAHQVIARLKAAGATTIFSYPRREGDSDLRPSPLVRHLPEAKPVFAAKVDILSQIAATSLTLEQLDDSQAPPVATVSEKGGTSILKDQALCPFRAFAHHRLRVRSFDEAQPGLDAMTRGSLLHKALELFWHAIKNQQQLIDLTPDQRDQQVFQAVTKAIDEYYAERPKPQAELLAIEQDRLQGLLDDWLTTIELKRMPFQVVHLEAEQFETIGPLQIRTVVDRMDQLEDGSLIILDYKTGKVEAELLIGDRLLEPQLPIYAISRSDHDADGIAFAQVRRGQCKLIGVARTAELLPGVEAVENHRRARQQELHNWDELLHHWRNQLESLAEDFVAGIARVDPAAEKYACRYCDLSSLCRIVEAEKEGEVQ